MYKQQQRVARGPDSRDAKPLEGAASQLTDAQYREILEAFKLFDLDDSKSLDRDEIGKALVTTGVASSDEEVDHLMEQMDTDQNGFVEWEEYLEFSAKTMLSPRGHLATSETELALHMLLMHCALPDAGPSPGLVSGRSSGRREDNVMLDVEGIISLFRSAGYEPLSAEEADSLRKQIDPHGRGRVRFKDLRRLPVWDAAPVTRMPTGRTRFRLQLRDGDHLGTPTTPLQLAPTPPPAWMLEGGASGAGAVAAMPPPPPPWMFGAQPMMAPPPPWLNGRKELLPPGARAPAAAEEEGEEEEEETRLPRGKAHSPPPRMSPPPPRMSPPPPRMSPPPQFFMSPPPQFVPPQPQQPRRQVRIAEPPDAAPEEPVEEDTSSGVTGWLGKLLGTPPPASNTPAPRHDETPSDPPPRLMSAASSASAVRAKPPPPPPPPPSLKAAASSSVGYLGGHGGVMIAPEPVPLSAPPPQVVAHANWELAQMKLEAAEAVAQARLELAQAKVAMVQAHVGPSTPDLSA